MRKSSRISEKAGIDSHRVRDPIEMERIKEDA
jgi:hypothetical protein